MLHFCLQLCKKNMAELMSSANTATPVDVNPFNHLQLSSWEPLRQVVGRSLCPKCKRSRKYFCYTCYEIVGLDPSLVPRVRLPVKLDIIKHPLEVVGKSTATHAGVIAPDDVSIHTFPEIPHYADVSKVVLVFPKEGSLSTSEFAHLLRQNQQDTDTVESLGSGDSHSRWKGVDRVVVIDSTWQQTYSILKDDRISRLPCVRLSNTETFFWRPQTKTNEHLATIEAIYYFFKEMQQLLTNRLYDGCFDNLLYFYAYQYGVVQRAQEERGH